jgi:hypothetical protein
VKRSILETFVDEKKVDYVFERLDSSIASDNFIAVKNEAMFLVSFYGPKPTVKEPICPSQIS